MDLIHIKNTIDNYNDLLDFVKSKIKVIEEMDNHYYTGKGIEELSFCDGDVIVLCYSNRFGLLGETHSFIFPIIWISKTDDELKEIVFYAKELREEKKRKDEEETEKREFERYQKLKMKFEHQTPHKGET